MELSDQNMMTGYARLVGADTTFRLGFEPDGIDVRLMTKFDSLGGGVFDYAYKNNNIQAGFSTSLPSLIKASMDDGVTSGEISAIMDGKQHYYKVAQNTDNSIKGMVTGGRPGYTVVFRMFPLFINNEALSGKRAVLNYYNENDQIEYAYRIEVADNGAVHIFVKQAGSYYYSFSGSGVLTSTIAPDYTNADFNVDDYITAIIVDQTIFPILYVDLAFEFTFATNTISLYKNGVSIPMTAGTANSSQWPASFADPPPPTQQQQPYITPLVNVYHSTDQTTSKKINALSVSPQTSPYSVDPGDPQNDPLITVYDIAGGVATAANPQTMIANTFFSGKTISTIPLCKDTSNSNNCSQAALQISDTSTAGLTGVAVNGKVPTRCNFTLTGANGPVGTYYCRMWDANGNVVETFASADAAELDNVTLTMGFNDNGNTVAIAQNFRLGIEYTTGATTDTLKLQRCTDGDASVAQTVVKPGASNWTINTTYDVNIQIFTGIGTSATVPYVALANTTGGIQACGECVGANTTLEGVIPTTMLFTVYRTTTATAGTVTIRHVKGPTVIADLLSVSVASLPTTQPSSPNLVWQDLNYSVAINSTDVIAIYVTGVNAGTVNVMNNSGNQVLANSFNGVNSFMVFLNVGATTWAYTDTTIDLAATILSGGASFSGYIELNDVRKRTGILLNAANSILVGQKITVVTVVFKKFNSAPADNIYCRIRDSAGNIKATMGQVATSLIFGSDTSIDFINRQNTYSLVAGDTISIEYASGTATDYIVVRINTGQIDGESTGLFESLGTSNTTTKIQNRDLAAVVLVGGVPDLTARPRRGWKINANSVLIGKAITSVLFSLKATGTFPLGKKVKLLILRGTDKAIIANLGELEASTVDTAAFVNIHATDTSSNYALKAGDMIAVECDFGDVNNYMSMGMSTASVIDGTNTDMFEWDGFVYTEVAANDPFGDLWTGGYLVIPDPTTPQPVIPYHWWHGHIVAAGLPVDSGATTDPDNMAPTTGTYMNVILKEFRVYSMLLTTQQLLNYYNNKFTISPVAFGHVRVSGHDILIQNAPP